MVGMNESQTVTPTGGNEFDLSGGVVLYYHRSCFFCVDFIYANYARERKFA